MVSITNLSRPEAKALHEQLGNILDNKEMNQIQIVHSKGEMFVSRSTDGIQPLVKSELPPIEMD